MTKKRITEEQMIKIVEDATRHALTNILSEGAGWDALVQGFKGGLNGTYDIDNFDEKAKRYIKNGKNGTNWDDFKQDREEYNIARKNDIKKRENLQAKKKNADSWSTAEMERAHNLSKTAKGERDAAANNAVGSRPGIIGKGQRAAAVGAIKAGKFGKKMKDSATNFMHNNIGLEE